MSKHVQAVKSVTSLRHALEVSGAAFVPEAETGCAGCNCFKRVHCGWGEGLGFRV